MAEANNDGRIVAVLDGNGATATRVGSMDLGVSVEPVKDLDDALRIAGRNKCVLIVDHTSATPEFFGDLGNLRGRVSLPTIVVANKPSASLLRNALRAGAADVVGLNGSSTDLADALDRAWQSGSPGGVRGHEGRIVTVFSAKGGVGCTTLAVNLAAQTGHGQRTSMIIDADLPFGDVSVIFGVEPRSGLADLTGADLDADRISAATTVHRSGVRVVSGPADPALADAITPTTITHVFDLARTMADTIIVDTSCAFDDVTLAALETSDEIIVVTTPDLAAVKNAKIALSTLKLLAIPEERIHVVFNRVGGKSSLGAAEMESQLGAPLAVIPDDDAFARCVSAGQIGVIELPRNPASKAVMKLAEHVVTGGRS